MTKPAAPPCPICLAAPCANRDHAAQLARIAAGKVRCSTRKHAGNSTPVTARWYSATAGPLCSVCWIERFGAPREAWRGRLRVVPRRGPRRPNG